MEVEGKDEFPLTDALCFTECFEEINEICLRFWGLILNQKFAFSPAKMSHPGGQSEFSDRKSLVQVIAPSHFQGSRYFVKLIFSYIKLNGDLEM